MPTLSKLPAITINGTALTDDQSLIVLRALTDLVPVLGADLETLKSDGQSSHALTYAALRVRWLREVMDTIFTDQQGA